MENKILVTGSAGFIGFHLIKGLLDLGYKVIGIDNINDYYDPILKFNRLRALDEFVNQRGFECNYEFIKLDISDDKRLIELFERNNFSIVINLAAQAGVRYSIEKPKEYINSNLVGFSNIIECCRNYNIKHFIFASSSSVYGMNISQPFSVYDNTDFPISLYAATKKSNELIAHSYSHLYKIPCTGLRFFTVYGPYGRPDMAYFSFTKAIVEGRPIDIYNYGKMKRDFTYIDDIINSVLMIAQRTPNPVKRTTTNAIAPFRIFNLGNNNPIPLSRFIKAIEVALSKKSIKNLLPMQDGDVPLTYADINEFISEYDYSPVMDIENGIKKFVDWYLDTYQFE